MTPEALKDLARETAADMLSKLSTRTDPLLLDACTLAIAHVLERAVSEAREESLRLACAAVCFRCKAGDEPHAGGMLFYHWIQDTPGPPRRRAECLSTWIRRAFAEKPL